MNAIHLDNYELIDRGPGFRVNFPMHSATGTASSATVVFEIDPGHELHTHRDSAEEILVVLQGTGEAWVGDEVTEVGPHDMAIVPPMEPHGVRNTGDEPMRVVGTFSASTVVSTFETPLEEGGPDVLVIGSPVPMGSYLREAVGV